MSKVRKVHIVNLIIVLCLIISGCGNKKGDKYHAFSNDFYDIYFQIAEEIEGIDPMNIAQSMESDNIKGKMNSLKELFDKFDEDIPENKQHNYKKLSEWYDELVDLSNKKYEDWWVITLDERMLAHTTLIGISVRLSNWNDKDSGIVWDQ
ncbi:hypothetical protein AN1V17_40720 [Vallitalea sediminicola]